MDLSTYDLRVWDAYYSAWEPLTPVISVQISKTGGMAVDQATITLPGDHRLSHVFREAAARPIPLTWELNGVVWSGQVTNPVRSLGEDGVPEWTLHVESDDKHPHRLQSRDPADTSEPEIRRATIGAHLADMLRAAVNRTGLPTYVKVDGDGGPIVSIEARIEDSIASLMEGHVESSDVFVDTRMLLPGQRIPGDPNVDVWFMSGATEKEWLGAGVAQGLWPNATPTPRIKTPPTQPYYAVPPGRFRGTWLGWPQKPTGVTGQPATDDQMGLTHWWFPFEVERDREQNPSYRVNVWSPLARAATEAELVEHAQKQDYWMVESFITEWEPGTWVAGTHNMGMVAPRKKAGDARLLQRLDGPLVVTEADQAALDTWIGSGAAYAWRRADGVWIVANQSAFDAELSRLRKVHALAAGTQVPAVLVHVHPGRDRRHVVFSAAPGGGVEGWETSIRARDAAAVISGMQMDQWQSKMTLDQTTARLGVGELAESDVWRGGPVNVSGMTEVTSDVAPSVTVEDSLVAFGQVAGRVDIAEVGPFHYRERFVSISGSSGSDLVQQVHRAWAEAQGGTALTLETRGGPVIFGDDRDGRLGWHVGDRVTFIDDKGQQVSEVITGWEFEHQQGEAPTVSPILGRDVHLWSPLDRLVDKIVDTDKGLVKSRLSAPAGVSQDMVRSTVADQLTPYDKAIQDLWQKISEGSTQPPDQSTGTVTVWMADGQQSSEYFYARVDKNADGLRTLLQVTARGTWEGSVRVAYRVNGGAHQEAGFTVTADSRSSSWHRAAGFAEVKLHYTIMNA